MYGFLLAINLRMKLPSHRGVCVCLASVDAGKQLSKVVYQFRVTKTWWCHSLHFSLSGVSVPHYGFTWHFFLMTDEIEHLRIYLSTISTSFMKYLFKSLPLFLLGCLLRHFIHTHIHTHTTDKKKSNWSVA